MSDFESIELQVEASANNAEKGLDNIDKALANIQGSLKGITDILGNLDSKIAPISRSMNRLAGDIEKLNPDIFKRFSNSVKQSADDTEKAAKRIESNVKTLANNLKDSFHIDRKGTAELKQALTDLYNAQEKMAFADKIGDQRTFDEAGRAADVLKNKIADIVSTYGKVKQAGIEAYKDLFDTVQRYFNGEKPVYIPVEFVNEHLDGEAKKMASAFGKNFTTDITKDWGVALIQMVEDIEGAVNNAEFPQFGFLQGKLTGNAVNDFKIIYDYAVKAKDEMLSMSTAIGKDTSVAENFKTKIDETVSSIEKLAQTETDSFMQSGMDNYVSDMQEVEQESVKVKESLNEIKESASTLSEVSSLEKLGEIGSTVSQSLNSVTEGFTDATKEVEVFEDTLGEIEETYHNFQNPVKIFDENILNTVENVRNSIGELDKQIKELEQSYTDIQSAFNSDMLGEYSQSYKSVLFKEKETISQLLPLLKERKELLENIRVNRSNSLESYMEADAGLRIDKEKAQEASKLVAEYEKLQLKEQQLVETGSAFKNAIGDTAKKFKDFSEEVKGIPKIDISGDKSNTEIEQLIAKVKKLRELISGMKNGSIKGFGDDQFRDLNSQLATAETRLNEISGAMGKVRSDTWSDVLKDIESMQKDYGKLTETIGGFNAEMQIAQDITNRVKSAMSATKSGKMLIDVDKMQEANEKLHETERALEIFYDQFKEPLEIDTVQPRSELGKLYDRAKEIQAVLDSMRNNRIQFDTSDVQRNIKELEEVNAKIKELEGRGSAPQKDKGGVEWLAKVIAMQHELEKASALFSKFGDIAKNAFLKALTPLKLFVHEFEEIKGLATMVARIGSAFAMISKPITKVFDDFSKKAVKSFDKIRKSWAKVVRTFTYMLIRKAITHIISTINDAIISLAAFSKEIGTSFNYSMSVLTSDLRYIGAALTAAFAPILNAIIPSFDSLTDTIVGVINKVNMFLAVLTRAKSYTIAKKKLVDYTEAMEDANKKAKQLTMGIDELNILNDSQESSKKDEDKFDWLEIPTPTIDIPDWMKWIKELLQKLWDAIMGMLKALWNALKQAWVNVRDFFLKAFKHLIESIVGLITDIIRDLTRLFNTEKFREFLEQCFRIIAKIAELIATIIDRIREAWNYNELGYRILEAILDILITIATHIENMLDAAIAWAKELNFIPLFEAFLKLLQQVNYAIDQIGWVIEDVFETLFLPLLKLVIEDYLPRLILVLGNIVEGIGNIARKFHEAWQATSFGERAVKAIDDVVQALLPHIEAVGESFKEWGNQINFEPLLNSLIGLLKALEPVADMIGGVFEDLVNHYIEPVTQHIIEEIIPGIADAMAHFADTLDENKLRNNIDKIIKAFASLSEAIGGGVVKAMDSLGQKLANFANSKAFSDFIDTLTGFISKIDADMVAKVLDGIGTAILHLAQAVVKFGNSEMFKDFLDAIINFMKNSSVQDIASTIEGIAKAFLAFKGLSFLTEIASHIAGLAVPIVQLIKLIGGTGSLGLVGAIAAGIAAFVMFHDQIARIDWAGLFDTITNAILGLIEAIDWESVARDLGETIANLVILAVKIAFDPSWQIRLIEVIGTALIEAVKGLGNGIIDTIKEKFHEIGIYSIDGLLEGVRAGWNGFIGWIGKVFKWLIDFVKGILGINSPSKVFYDIGFNVIQGLWNGIKAVWDAFYMWISGIWTAFVTFAGEIWGLVVGAVIGAWNGFIGRIQEVWALISEWFNTTWLAFQTWAIELWNLIVQSIVNVWNTFVENIQLIWETIRVWFEEAWTAFQLWVAEIWALIVQSIVDAWTDFTDKISAIWNKFSEFIHKAWENFKTWASQLWEKVKETIVKAWQTVHDKTIELWNKIKAKIKEVWDWLKAKVVEVFNAVRDKILEVWEKVKNVTLEVWGKIKSFLDEVWKFIKNTAKEVFNFIKNTIVEVWETIRNKTLEVWNKIKGFLIDLWEKIKKEADRIFSWIRDFITKIWDKVKEIWTKVWTSIVEAILKIWNDFKKKVHDIWDKIVGFFEKIWDKIKGIWQKIWNEIIGAIKKIWSDFSGEISKIWTAITDKIKDVWNTVKESWEKVWTGIKDFIKNIANTIIGLVEGMVNGVVKAVNTVIDALNSFSIDIDIPDPIKQALGMGNLHIGIPRISKVPEIRLPRFASGGFPEDGWFRASHGEIMGRFDNGQSVVANNSQITDGIAQAVSQSLVPILNDIADSNRVVANKDFSVDIDSREIARANNNGQSKLGRSMISFT